MGKFVLYAFFAITAARGVIDLLLFVAGLSTLPEDISPIVDWVRDMVGSSYGFVDWAVLGLGFVCLFLGATWGRWQLAWRAVRDRDRLAELSREANELSHKLSERAAAHRTASQSRMFDRGDWNTARAEEFRSSNIEIDRYIRELLPECAAVQDELREHDIFITDSISGQELLFITSGALNFNMVDAAKSFKIAARKIERQRQLGWKLIIDDQKR